MSPNIQNSLIMIGLLFLAIFIVIAIIRIIAGKGIILTITFAIMVIIMIDVELGFILGQIEFTLKNIILLFSPGMFLTTITILLLHRLIVIPVRSLMDTTKYLAEGDLSGDVSFSNKNEIGQLAASLSKVIAYQRKMSEVANQIADGKLGISVDAKSEMDVLGLAFHNMIDQLNIVIHQVSDNASDLLDSSQLLASSSDQAGRATNQIATTIQQVAQGTAQQSESLTQTAMSVSQMNQIIDGVVKGVENQSRAINNVADITGQLSTMIQQVSLNAKTGADGSVEATQVAQEGSQTVKETMQGMQTIHLKVSQSAQKVHDMRTHSQQIGVIVETIDDIASQTNLLALNAAIEAARAGEQGKGFAVVADEVRKLAERASSSAKEIGTLVNDMQQTISSAVEAMNQGSEEVERGVNQANQAGQALDQIMTSVEKVNQQVLEISTAAVKMDAMSSDLVSATDAVSEVVEENTAAMQQMSTGAEEVDRSVDTIASISEENNASVEEISASTEEMTAQVEEVTAAAQSLAEMASSLENVVSQFSFSTNDE
ncbi:MAG: HAMP domain-containing protein [Anaerolineaceae bacterium]|nr:HAMP domain-containing protein [Anaerolineaceae bacterium]